MADMRPVNALRQPHRSTNLRRRRLRLQARRNDMSSRHRLISTPSRGGDLESIPNPVCRCVAGPPADPSNWTQPQMLGSRRTGSIAYETRATWSSAFARRNGGSPRGSRPRIRPGCFADPVPALWQGCGTLGRAVGAASCGFASSGSSRQPLHSGCRIGRAATRARRSGQSRRRIRRRNRGPGARRAKC